MSSSYSDSSHNTSNISSSKSDTDNDPKKISRQMRYYKRNQDKLKQYYRDKMRQKHGHKPQLKMSEEETLFIFGQRKLIQYT